MTGNKREFRNLSACVAWLAQRYPRETLSESRDFDTGEAFRGARFPRWLFRGEHQCYPSSRPALARLRTGGVAYTAELEDVTEFAHKYLVHHLVLPYIGELDHFKSLEWMAVSATYEALAFCQHYGLPTNLSDFTASLRVAAQFACGGSVASDACGRIAVLDASVAKASSQIWDLQDLSATRAARQRAYGVYIAGNPDLCDPALQQRLGLRWFRFRRDWTDEMRWRRGFARLLAVNNDRLAGWIRHAIAICARQHGPLAGHTADYLVRRVPIVPLVARLGPQRGQVAFQLPLSIAFDEAAEVRRTLRDWTKKRVVHDRPRRAYQRIPDTHLVRFLGT